MTTVNHTTARPSAQPGNAIQTHNTATTYLAQQQWRLLAPTNIRHIQKNMEDAAKLAIVKRISTPLQNFNGVATKHGKSLAQKNYCNVLPHRIGIEKPQREQRSYGTNNAPDKP
jgi:hypothetical protein